MKTSTITLRLSEIEKAKLAAIAREKDISVSQLIREACREFLKREEK